MENKTETKQLAKAQEFYADLPHLIGAFYEGKSESTFRAYQTDLEDFRRFVGADSAENAARLLLGRGPGGANALVLSYRADLLEKKLSPATINRRLAALRSLVKLARVLGLVTWALEVPGVRSKAYRDTRGGSRSDFAAALQQLEGRKDAKGKRDSALLRLLHDLGLRRNEAVSLDLEHIDLEAGTVSVMGKARRERELLTLPLETRAALSAWLEVRGNAVGPVFLNLSRNGTRGRLTGTAVYLIVKGLGLLRPHGLRHMAITSALDLSGGNVRAVQKFSRHADLRTLQVYDDNRADLGGDIARRVAAGI